MPDKKTSTKTSKPGTKPQQSNADARAQAKSDLRNGRKNEAAPAAPTKLTDGHTVGAGRVMVRTTWDRGEVNGEVQRNTRQKFYEEQRLKVQREIELEAEKEREKMRNKAMKGGRK